MRKYLMILCALMCYWTSLAYAHKPSDSYLTLKVIDNKIDGQWDIALRDLDFAIGLDRDGNGDLTWDEVRSKHDDIAAYALARLSLSNAGKSCPASVEQHLIDNHTDGAYAVLRFRAVCPEKIASLSVAYHLLFDIDPQHKGLLRLENKGQTSTAIFSPESATQMFSLAEPDKLRQFLNYLKTGVWHIWIGFDHILFLLSLLLPAVLIHEKNKWAPATTFKMALVDVLKIVTAFTLAHSITLTLATLQIIALPSRWVESAIALSVVIAALNNIFPLVQGRRWVAAFAFGLIHGFGFASVLTDLGLPRSALILSLVGFNVGVELGQLAIVAAFLPIAYAMRKSWAYQKMVFTTGSGLIVVVALVWFVERAGNVKYFNF